MAASAALAGCGTAAHRQATLAPATTPSATRAAFGTTDWYCLNAGERRGVAGAGKTGLAVHWSHQAAGRFPDGQLFADLRGFDAHEEPVSAAAVLDQFLRALGVPGPQIPAEVAGRTALLRTLLNRRRVLIVLDNARTAGQIRPLLPGSGTCFVLVTSRGRLDDLVALRGARYGGPAGGRAAAA